MKKLHEIYPDCSWQEREINCYETFEDAREDFLHDLEEMEGDVFRVEEDPEWILDKIESARTAYNDVMYSYVCMVGDVPYLQLIREWKNAR